MIPQADPPSDHLGISLPLAVLGLAAWQALPTLIGAWSHDLYARGAPLAFGIWLATQGWLVLNNRHLGAPASVGWLVVALLLCAVGAMSGLRVLHHLALACAVAGLPGWRLGGGVTPKAIRLAGGTPNTVSLAGGQASRLSGPTGVPPVVASADRRDALSSLTGGTPVFRSRSAKLPVLGGTPVFRSRSAKLTVLGGTTLAALAWLPASGWFLSHWKTGGLGGWERPALAAMMALLLLTLSRAPASSTPHALAP